MKRIFLFLFLLISFFANGQGLQLTTTNHTLEITTSTTAGIDYYIMWGDLAISGSDVTGGVPGASYGKITTATTTTAVAAPSSGFQRAIKSISIVNVGTESN